MKEADSVRVVAVVDNNVWKEGLTSNWGISFLLKPFTTMGNKTS